MGFTSDRMSRASGLREVSPMDQLIIERNNMLHGGSTAGVTVNNRVAHGIPALTAAIEFAAEAVAQLTPCVWTGTRKIREPVQNGWQTGLFANAPNGQQDEFDFWHTIESSLGWRHNAYIWKVKNANGRVVERVALHPDQVLPFRSIRTRRKRFTITFLDNLPLPRDVDGYGSVDVDEDTIIHIRGRGGTGELVAPSPIALFRQSLGLAVAKREHEASLFANSAAKGLLLSFPAGTSKEDADKWRDGFDGNHVGPSKSGKTKVIGGGATVSEITMTQADAQFVESWELSLRDIALISHMPSWLIAGIAGVSAKGMPPSGPEAEMQRWLYFYLGPRLARIESAINADQDLFGAGPLFMAFDTTDVVRGDLATEDKIAHQQIQDGRLLPDEWRTERGRAPLPGGVGMVPQITPVGGAPNPVTPFVQQDAEDD